MIPMNRFRGARQTLPLLLGLTLAGGVHAGTAVISSSDGGNAVFEYNDTMLRMGAEGTTSYGLFRDGNMYAVTFEGGNPMVIDAGSMMKGLAGMTTQAAPSDLDAKIISLKDTGENETVAGVTGDVYELRFEDEDGSERTETLVLSTDRRAREFRDALFMMMSFAQDIASEQAMEQGRDMRQRLEKMNAGILRYGQEMVVTRIDADKVADERFDLPAQPMNLEGLGSMLSNIAKQAEAANAEQAATSGEAVSSAEASDAVGASEETKKGGLFSSMMGALGGKAEETGEKTANKVETKVDQKVDEETDKGIDKALGKAFGKIFGGGG